MKIVRIKKFKLNCSEYVNHIIFFIYDKSKSMLIARRHKTIFIKPICNYLFFATGTTIRFFPQAEHYNSVKNIDIMQYKAILKKINTKKYDSFYIGKYEITKKSDNTKSYGARFGNIE